MAIDTYHNIRVCGFNVAVFPFSIHGVNQPFAKELALHCHGVESRSEGVCERKLWSV